MCMYFLHLLCCFLLFFQFTYAVANDCESEFSAGAEVKSRLLIKLKNLPYYKGRDFDSSGSNIGFPKHILMLLGKDMRLGDLIIMTVADLSKIKGFNIAKIREVQSILTKMGLRLGMIITDWQPQPKMGWHKSD